MFGHQSNDRAITTRDRPLVASGQVWLVIKRAGGELLCESNNAKKSKRQITKAMFEKWQKELEMEHQTLS